VHPTETCVNCGAFSKAQYICGGENDSKEIHQGSGVKGKQIGAVEKIHRMNR